MVAELAELALSLLVVPSRKLQNEKKGSHD